MAQIINNIGGNNLMNVGFANLPSSFGNLPKTGGIRSDTTIGDRGVVNFVEMMMDNSPNQGEFYFGQPSISQTIAVDYGNVNLAMREILGENTVVGNKLRRTPPIRHAQFPWLVAWKVSGPRGFSAAPGIRSNVPNSNPMATWLYALLTITYAAVPCAFTEGADIADESTRYLIKQPYMPSIRVLQRKAGQVKWAEGPSVGKGLEYGTGKYQPRGQVKMTWLRVPENYVCNQGVPTQFWAAIGKVNNDEAVTGKKFLNIYKDGTLLLQSPAFNPLIAPYSVQNDINNITISRLFDIDITFDHFEASSAVGAYHGHNVALHPNGGYYLVTDDGTVNGNRLVAGATFANLFKYWGD